MDRAITATERRNLRPGLSQALYTRHTLCHPELIAVRRDQQPPRGQLPGSISDENHDYGGVLSCPVGETTIANEMDGTTLPCGRRWYRTGSNCGWKQPYGTAHA